MNFVTDKYPADFGKVIQEEDTEISISKEETVVEDIVSSENREEINETNDLGNVIDKNEDTVIEELLEPIEKDIIGNIENTASESTEVIEEEILNESEVISSEVENAVEVATELVEPEMLDEESVGINIINHFLVSDYSWYSTSDEVDFNISDTNDDWSLVTRVKLPYSEDILTKFNDQGALSITHLFEEIQNREVKTYYFKKISVNSKFVKARLNMIGNKSMKVWLNANKILDEKEIQESIEINDVVLLNGDNIILVELTGNDNETGFIFELMYQTTD